MHYDLYYWMKLGVFLGIPYPTLRKIEVDKQGVDNCKMAMFDYWLSTGNASKETLLKVVRKMDCNSK